MSWQMHWLLSILCAGANSLLCRACNASGQGQVMMGFAVIALLAGLVALFARDWGTDTGPGALTKLKIFITHLQVGPIVSCSCHSGM